jgi:hypothetical protein
LRAPSARTGVTKKKIKKENKKIGDLIENPISNFGNFKREKGNKKSES